MRSLRGVWFIFLSTLSRSRCNVSGTKRCKFDVSGIKRRKFDVSGIMLKAEALFLIILNDVLGKSKIFGCYCLIL